jgi:NAD(P)H-dependent flavin oxidoreductase YrpB (nitropropane dioxygenase family)
MQGQKELQPSTSVFFSCKVLGMEARVLHTLLTQLCPQPCSPVFTKDHEPACLGIPTQEKMEKKLKVMAARAESAPTSTSLSLVAAHWLVRKQKPTNHRKVQRAGERTEGGGSVSGRGRGFPGT